MRNTMVGLVLHLLYGESYSRDHCKSHMMMLHRIIQFHYRAFIELKIQSPGRWFRISTSLASHSYFTSDPAVDHLLDLTDSDSFVDFLSLCFIGIMSNVLDIRTYQEDPEFEDVDGFAEAFDMNAMPFKDRARCVHIRALSYHLLDWCFTTYNIVDGTEGPIEDARHLVFDEPFADLLTVIRRARLSCFFFCNTLTPACHLLSVSVTLFGPVICNSTLYNKIAHLHKYIFDEQLILRGNQRPVM